MLRFTHTRGMPPQVKSVLSEMVLTKWLKELEAKDWNVFIQGPPHEKCDPEHVLKYLTRHMTGGPISDSRLVNVENDQVISLARSKNKRAGTPLVEVSRSVIERVKRSKNVGRKMVGVIFRPACFDYRIGFDCLFDCL